VEGELHLLLDYVINRYQYLHTDQDDNKPLQKIRLPVLKDLLKKPDVVLQSTNTSIYSRIDSKSESSY
jgi:excinuclease UvrABC helicase subunit UvrB